MTIRKNRIEIKDGRLLINGTYYRKTNRRFKKKKGQLGIPLSYITSATVKHNRLAGRILASFLLLVIFAAGAGVSAWYARLSWQEYRAPYGQERKEEILEELDRIKDSLPAEQAALEQQIQVLNEQLDETRSQQQELTKLREQEQMKEILADPAFDSNALLASDFFDHAYREYLEDLFNAFLQDEKLHSWLYPYYQYSLTEGKNPYIQDEMYFYTAEGEETFSSLTENPRALLYNAYNFDLGQHLYYTGRIYITGSDFLNRVLHVPDYVANGAVFVKAYGGNPDPAQLEVPGFNSGEYKRFWQDAPSYFDQVDPVWVHYGMTAADFDISWDELLNEQAYYDAYLKFMDAIAPGLEVFDMVSYSAGDDSYAGMYYKITGREASPTQIMTLYLQSNPDYLKHLGLDPETFPTSCDEKLADLQEETDTLEQNLKELTDQHQELTAAIQNRETLSAEYETLTESIEIRRENLLRNLTVFCIIFLILFVMALVSLAAFIRLLKKPGRLAELKLTDQTEAAFSLRGCSKKKTRLLMERINPEQPA